MKIYSFALLARSPTDASRKMTPIPSLMTLPTLTSPDPTLRTTPETGALIEVS
jgi:hypothetical protein